MLSTICFSKSLNPGDEGGQLENYNWNGETKDMMCFVVFIINLKKNIGNINMIKHVILDYSWYKILYNISIFWVHRLRGIYGSCEALHRLCTSAIEAWMKVSLICGLCLQRDEVLTLCQFKPQVLRAWDMFGFMLQTKIATLTSARVWINLSFGTQTVRNIYVFWSLDFSYFTLFWFVIVY